MYIEYRGKITDEYVEKLIKTEAPIKPIITLKKIKALLPSLKVGTSKSLSSNLIYKFECSRCKTSYVGMTQRHFCSRISEHQQNGGKSVERKSPIRMHTEQCCGDQPNTQDFRILRQVQNPNVVYLSIMEALYIREYKLV